MLKDIPRTYLNSVIPSCLAIIFFDRFHPSIFPYSHDRSF